MINLECNSKDKSVDNYCLAMEHSDRIIVIDNENNVYSTQRD